MIKKGLKDVLILSEYNCYTIYTLYIIAPRHFTGDEYIVFHANVFYFLCVCQKRL